MKPALPDLRGKETDRHMGTTRANGEVLGISEMLRLETKGNRFPRGEEGGMGIGTWGNGAGPHVEIGSDSYRKI